MTQNWPQIFGAEEWNWIQKIGSEKHDPEEKRIFWETVKSKKLADPKYSIFTDFPKELPPMPEAPAAKGAVAKSICTKILQDLKAKGCDRKEPA